MYKTQNSLFDSQPYIRGKMEKEYRVTCIISTMGLIARTPSNYERKFTWINYAHHIIGLYHYSNGHENVYE